MALSETLDVREDGCPKAVLDSDSEEEENHERSAHLSSGSTAERFLSVATTSSPDKLTVKRQKDVISGKPT